MEEKFKWRDFPYEVQQFLAVRFFLITLGYIAILIFGISTNLVSACLLFTGILTVYLIFQINFYHQVTDKQIIVYTGICEKKNTPSFSFNNPVSRQKKNLFHSYGHCTITLLIGDKKLIVPVGAGFSVENGNEVRVYTHINDVTVKNDNTYAVSNPFIVKVSKS